MIIFIEGVDGSGKSTLAQSLDCHLAAQYPELNVFLGEQLINTKPGDDRITNLELYTALNRWASDRESVVILDRGPISDMIYRIFDEENSVSNLDEFVKWLDVGEAFAHDVLLIYCRNFMSKQSMEFRGDSNPISRFYHPVLSHLYDAFMLKLSYHALLFKYNWLVDKKRRKIFCNVRKFVESRCERARRKEICD